MALQENATVVFRLCAFARYESGSWVAYCPSLDLASQGETQVEARHNLEEAIELWVESCLERNTLARAMDELGWHRAEVGMAAPAGQEHPGVLPIDANDGDGADSVLGELFPLELQIPAFLAAHSSGSPDAR